MAKLSESVFFTKKWVPKTKGEENEYERSTDSRMKSNFERLCKWLDRKTELFTLSETHAKLCSFAEKDLNGLLFKVACMINIKLVFMVWFCYNLIMLVK